MITLSGSGDIARRIGLAVKTHIAHLKVWQKLLFVPILNLFLTNLIAMSESESVVLAM